VHENIGIEGFGVSTLGRSGGRGIGACAEAEVEILYSEDVPGIPTPGALKVVNPFKQAPLYYAPIGPRHSPLATLRYPWVSRRSF